MVEIDGARIALGGYLYQVVSGIGLVARCIGFDDTKPGDLLCDLIIEAKGARVFHEMSGQDLILRKENDTENTGIAVQIKYTSDVRNNPITPSDMRDILQKFDECRSNRSSEFPIDKFVLLTNRELSKDMQVYYEKREHNYDEISTDQRKWLNVANRNKKRINSQYGSIDKASRDWYGVFQSLSIFPRISSNTWMESLKAYAKSRGVLDFEFEEAFHRLLGSAIQSTVDGSVELSMSWLNKCIVGFPNARTLGLATCEPNSARIKSLESFTRWCNESVAYSEGSCIRRHYSDKIRDGIAQHSIVFVIGAGGCGKSTLAAHSLLATVSNHFVAGTSARDIHPQWLSRLFNNWRDSDSYHLLSDSTIEDILRRIRYANTDTSGPLIIIDIDGLDENHCSHRRDEIRSLIHICKQHREYGDDSLAVVLTSRASSLHIGRSIRDLLSNYFSYEFSFRYQDDFTIIEVGDFSDHEFVSVILNADVSVRQRLLVSLNIRELSVPGLGIDDIGADMYVRPTDRSILASLRHPVVWGVFSHLPAEVQHEVLNGDPNGLHSLTGHFVERFCQKVNRRHPDLSPNRTYDVLIRIAKNYPANQTLAQLQNDWVTHAVRLSGELQSTTLFEEALSYGIIREEEPGQWTWRHEFLHRSLAAQEL